MATLTEERTVGEIAAELPASVRIFEKYGIDYCCGGRVPLAVACETRGIAAELLVAELDAATAPAPAASQDWRTASLPDLIDHILTAHHAFLKTELPRLSSLARKVTAAHIDAHGDTLIPLSETFEALRAELEAHLMKEEMVLFPMIKAGRTSVGNPIRVMVHEHDSAGVALERMRSITGNYALPTGACNSYRALYSGLQELEADLHRHIHLENNILFPRAAGL
ncbi:MAG: iron-sulfur cluster repair di-iron protein [Bryobacteraceae bacterium]